MRHYSLDISVNLRSKDDMRQHTIFSQYFKDMIGIFTALQVHAFGAGKLLTADS